MVLRNTVWIPITLAAVIVVALVILGVRYMEGHNERLDAIKNRGESSSEPPPERTPKPAQTTAPPEAKPSQPPNVRPPGAAIPDYDGAEPHVIPEKLPGHQDLDDYGEWLPRHQRPESSPLPAYRDETLTIPND
jgi:hypothetical protein